MLGTIIANLFYSFLTRLDSCFRSPASGLCSWVPPFCKSSPTLLPTRDESRAGRSSGRIGLHLYPWKIWNTVVRHSGFGRIRRRTKNKKSKMEINRETVRKERQRWGWCVRLTRGVDEKHGRHVKPGLRVDSFHYSSNLFSGSTGGAGKPREVDRERRVERSPSKRALGTAQEVRKGCLVGELPEPKAASAGRDLPDVG